MKTKAEIIEILKRYSMRYEQLHATDEDIIIEASDFEFIANALLQDEQKQAEERYKTVKALARRAGLFSETMDGYFMIASGFNPPKTQEG